jgi:hypothetical protein
MWKQSILTGVLFGISAVCMAVHLFPERALPLIFHRSPAPDIIHQEFEVAGERELTDQDLLAYQHGKSTIRTILTIDYKSPTSLDGTVNIAVTVDQHIAHYPPGKVGGSLELFDPSVRMDRVPSARWPIRLELTGAGAFDFGANGSQRAIAERTPLPITLRWHPTPIKAGNWVLMLKLKDVNGARSKYSDLVDRG